MHNPFKPSSGNIAPLRFWCQKVLPLVYDDSLSYYELLCKVVDYINNLIDTDNNIIADMDAMKSDLTVVKDFVDNFDTSYAEQVLRETIATMIFVEITDAGYIVYNIPDSWDDIQFNTTGLDINLDIQPEYGHLVLSSRGVY